MLTNTCSKMLVCLINITEVEILNGPQALAELRDIIIFSISVALVGDKKKLEAVLNND